MSKPEEQPLDEIVITVSGGCPPEPRELAFKRLASVPIETYIAGVKAAVADALDSELRRRLTAPPPEWGGS